MILRIDVEKHPYHELCHLGCKFMGMNSSKTATKCHAFDILLDHTWAYGDSVQFFRCSDCHKAEEI